MEDQPGFDVVAAHRYFAAECFNRAWELIEKPVRTAQEDADMIRLSHASHWHWTQVPGHTDENLSIGYWQTSRIYALLGEGENALRYAEQCLEVTRRLKSSPFLLGYAHEAMARAASLTGRREDAQQQVAQARQQAEQVVDAGQRNQLLADLATVT